MRYGARKRGRCGFARLPRREVRQMAMMLASQKRHDWGERVGY